jgi:uncharacterized protein (DUF2147 family)
MLHCPRKSVKPAFILSVILQAYCATAALAADPTGDWRVADGVANVRVAQCNGDIWGVVSWETQPGHDSNNPDASKRNRPTLGMPILIDMKKKAGTDSWEGQVYNAKDGQTYSASITPTDADHLEIKGCVMGFLCGGETWTRVAPPIPSSPTNSMAKGAKAGAQKAATPPAAAPAAAPPKAPGTVATAAPGAKGRAQPPDTVGDICLLRDIAGFAH